MRDKVHSVEISEISRLYFPREDALLTPGEKEMRSQQVAALNTTGKHTLLGIYFEDIEGLKCVLAEVIEVSNGMVRLWQNVSIPVHRIVDITLQNT